jgi:DNA repair exonuclease SbcCD ATPase subunit
MEFQEYAAQEVSALIDRLVSDAEARTEAVLTGSQREHDAALSSLRAQLEARGRELAERIRETEQLTAAGEETRRQLAAVHTEAEAQLADAQRREAELQRRFVAAAKTAERELTDARSAIEAAEGEMQRLETEHQQSLATINAVAEQEIADARSALDAAREEARRVETELQKGLTAASASAEKELAAARASLDAARAETHRLEEEHQRKLAAVSAAAEKELATARKALDAARADTHRLEEEHERTLASANAAAKKELAAASDAAEQELQEARAALEAAQAEAQRLTRQFDSALEELRQEHVNTLHQQAVARTALPLDELLAVFGSLASASTPSAVLTTVVSALGREFSRVALFRVRGGRLECVSHVGFEFEGDVAKVVIPTTVDSLMTRAVNARRTQTFVAASGDESCPVPFGGAPACAVALPLISGDAPVAVVYADDSDQLEFGSVPSELLVKFAELVWQHAILVLQRASAAQKMLAVAPVQSFERLA